MNGLYTRYRIAYASRGRIPDIAGELQVFVDAKLGPMPTIIDLAGRANMLDPRAVIRDGDGRVVYTPRDYPLDTHTKPMRAWLMDHPTWGVRP